MREFARLFERRAADAGMVEDDAKVLLVGSLNKDTLQRLDTYVMTQDNDEESRKGTIQDRLRRVSYASMLGFLKQSYLTELASKGARATSLGRPLFTQQGRPKTTSNIVDAGEVYPEVGDTFAGFSGGGSAGCRRCITITIVFYNAGAGRRKEGEGQGQDR